MKEGRCAASGARALSLNNNPPKVFIGEFFACTSALDSAYLQDPRSNAMNRFQTLAATYLALRCWHGRMILSYLRGSGRNEYQTFPLLHLTDGEDMRRQKISDVTKRKGKL